MTSIFRAAVPGELSFMTTTEHKEPASTAGQARAACAAPAPPLVALLVSAGPAAAAKSCGEKVIDDWFDGRIDGTYPLHCYDDAIEQLPRDVRDYSSAKEDIERALQARLRGETRRRTRSRSPTETTDDGDDDEEAGSAVPAGERRRLQRPDGRRRSRGDPARRPGRRERELGAGAAAAARAASPCSSSPAAPPATSCGACRRAA